MSISTPSRHKSLAVTLQLNRVPRGTPRRYAAVLLPFPAVQNGSEFRAEQQLIVESCAIGASSPRGESLQIASDDRPAPTLAACNDE